MLRRAGRMISRRTGAIPRLITGGSGLPIVAVGSTRFFTTLAAAIAGTTGPQEFVLDDELHQNVASIPQGRNGFVIRSTSGNPRACVMDGRGGIGSGFTLASGKGIIRTLSPGTIKGISFVNGGGGDGTADGEAGVYAESFAAVGTVYVTDCAFDNCEDAIFTPPISTTGANVDLVATNCEFGYFQQNGVTPDGLSHDVYTSSKSSTYINCRFAGSTNGNTLKCKSPSLTVTNCTIRSIAGRSIDYAHGGTLTVTGGTIFNTSSSNANFFDYGGENGDTNHYVQGVTPAPVFSGVTFVYARNATFWNNQTRLAIDLSACTHQKVGNAGTVVTGPGTFIGLPASPTVSVSAPVLPTSPWPLKPTVVTGQNFTAMAGAQIGDFVAAVATIGGAPTGFSLSGGQSGNFAISNSGQLTWAQTPGVAGTAYAFQVTATNAVGSNSAGVGVTMVAAPTVATAIYPVVESNLIGPATLMPSGTGQIVGINLTNPNGSASTAQYISWRQDFATGAVQPSNTITTSIAGTATAVQMDVTNLWPDGSVKSALLTLSTPAIPATTTRQLMLVAA